MGAVFFTASIFFNNAGLKLYRFCFGITSAGDKPRSLSCRQSVCDETSLYGMSCPLYFTAVFNLITLFFYSFCSLFFMYFLYRQNQRSAPERAKAKVPKSFALGKNLHKRPLLRPHNVSLRSGACSSLQAFACFQGAAELNLFNRQCQ